VTSETTPSTVTLLLADLSGLGIELALDPKRSDVLRYRPLDARTPELVEWVRTHKLNLLALLRAVSVLPSPIAGAHDTPRRRAGNVIRLARGAGLHDLAVALRDSRRERFAICSIDGGLPECEAERIAADELMLYFKNSASYCKGDEHALPTTAAGDKRQ
jgi:hypothetical protein